jgi:hypothetical protein
MSFRRNLYEQNVIGYNALEAGPDVSYCNPRIRGSAYRLAEAEGLEAAFAAGAGLLALGCLVALGLLHGGERERESALDRSRSKGARNGCRAGRFRK